jgi:RNA polymerase sigma-70 factor (ECF subfamily)
VDADSDDALLAALRAGDAGAFEAVVRDWSPGLLRAARGYVGSDAAAQEAVQETWLAVIAGLDRFEGRSRLRTWVHGILANVARRRGVQDHRSVPLSALVADGSDGPVVDPARFRGPGEERAGSWRDEAVPEPFGPEGRALGAELREMLLAALATLPERQRQVVVLRDLEGLSTPEVAQVLGLSEGNVRVLLHRGRMRLRELLEDYLRERVARAPQGVGRA